MANRRLTGCWPVREYGQQGFTLLELLIASAIAALLAVMSYVAVDQVIHLKEDVDARTRQETAIQRALWKLSTDLYQMAPRPVRDEYGQWRPALQWDGLALRFTRLVTGPVPEGASGVMRVVYRLEDGQLVRRSWSHADRLPDTPAQRLILLKGVRDWTVQLVDRNRMPQLDWPPLTPQGMLDLTALPRAVAIKLTLTDGREITRWVSGVDALEARP